MRLPQILVAGAVSLAVSVPALASHSNHHGETDAEAGVRAAVMDYFEGGNDGDSARVANAFEGEHGNMVMRRTGPDGVDTVGTMNLGEFASRFSRPIPYSRAGEIVDVRIVDETMAFAHFSFTTPDRQYDDFFVLYLINDEWKIVTKTFTVEAIEE